MLAYRSDIGLITGLCWQTLAGNQANTKYMSCAALYMKCCRLYRQEGRYLCRFTCIVSIPFITNHEALFNLALISNAVRSGARCQLVYSYTN